MVQKYLYIYIIISCITSFTVIAQKSYLPATHELEACLRETCHNKLCLIRRADTENYLGKIMACHQKITELETRNGITSYHQAQADIMNSLYKGKDHPQWCTLFEQFQEYDQKRGIICTTAKCQIKRLYDQLNHFTTKLAITLRPYNKELRELNEQICELKTKIKRSGNRTKFTMYPDMLFL